MSKTANVFSIAAGENFARLLAEGVISRVGRDPLSLSDALIFVPTRRAVQTLRDAFAHILGGASLGLRIRALGDIDENEDILTDDISGLPSMPPLRRRMMLARLVQHWAKAEMRSMPFAQAAVHAGELARLLDEVVSEGADLAALKTLAPDPLAEHWQELGRFLAIVGEQWPKILASEGYEEASAKRDAGLRALAARLAKTPPDFVVAAGSTGSIPATAELLKTIAYLDSGAVVLPGLDTYADQTAWDSIDEAHGQFGLRHLLQTIGIPRDEVRPWIAFPASPVREARRHFLSQALRPPPATDSWRALIANEKHALAVSLEDFALLEAANPREEALAIAIALREALETPGRKAALVTPDRGLARRVASELRRWSIDIDDSGGIKCARTPPGALLSLLARAAAEDFAPVPLLALLKHPLVSCGSSRIAFLQQVRALETLCLRGIRPEPGLKGITRSLARKNAPEALSAWWKQVASRLAPLAHAIHDLKAIAELSRVHGLTAESLAQTDERQGADILWQGDAGQVCALLIEELQEQSDAEISDARDYAELFRDLLEARVVRPAYGRHPRLAILGPLEARLQSFDLLILAGLNEATWPGEAATDPWLSRPMRKSLGLPSPERRIGLAAHDFYTLAAAPSVLLTRSVKQDGAPTVASRWVLRVKQLTAGLGLEDFLARRNDILSFARVLDTGASIPRAVRPNPTPPVSARPRSLRVTEIETLRRDPYAIYARHVLRLRPLDEIDLEPGPAERGTAVHAALEKFFIEFPTDLPDGAWDRLMQLGEEAFARAGATTAHLALWRPRFARAARWFLEWERERRSTVQRIFSECAGALAIKAPGGEFLLRGRADRIDLFADGSASILDYKTGQTPSTPQMETLIAPQLPLEGAMLKRGAFGGLEAKTIREMMHVRLTGGEPPGQAIAANLDADALANQAFELLQELIAEYDDPACGYLSLRMMMLTADYGDYDHLARVAEWRVRDVP